MSKPAITTFLDEMRQRGASDLHLKVGSSPVIRVHGDLVPLGGETLTEERMRELLGGLVTDSQLRRYEAEGNLDFAHSEESGRYRVNVFRQRGSTSVAIRLVKRLIRGFDELHLPAALAGIAELTQGLVIVAGITGCGKSTTLAAMVEHINSRRACHILTIEDPIEHVYRDKKAFINQREVGIDVEDFPTALKYAVREDPDVMLIGEMRDLETFTSAMAAAETGHLVFGTLHTSTAPQTLDRILSFFPRERHRLIRHALAFNLRAIICQMLLPSSRRDVDRVPAVEIMLTTPVVRKLILDEEDERLADAIRIGREEGMQDFTESFRQLVVADLVDRRVAFERAPNPEALRMALMGIVGGETGLLGGPSRGDLA
jgi:twitching motility protein PilT